MRQRLTQKQETFCLKYFELGNASEAARLARYSPRTAGAIGAENLSKPQIRARIDELRLKAEDASIAAPKERKQRLTEIARAGIPDFMTEEGIKINKDSSNVGAVSKITSRTKVYHKGGGPVNITTFELHNPIQAIQELNKMDHIYDEKPQFNDNRTYNIIVQGDGAREKVNQVLEGKRPDGIEGV